MARIDPEGRKRRADVRPGRRPTGPALLDYVNDYKMRAGLLTDRYPDIVTTGTGPHRPEGSEGGGDPTSDPQTT